MKRAYTLQENGQITLPSEWRDKYGLKKGDVITFEETEDGLLVTPKKLLAMKLLDEIGEALKDKGITLDDLMESGREIRRDIADKRARRTTNSKE